MQLVLIHADIFHLNIIYISVGKYLQVDTHVEDIMELIGIRAPLCPMSFGLGLRLSILVTGGITLKALYMLNFVEIYMNEDLYHFHGENYRHK